MTSSQGASVSQDFLAHAEEDHNPKCADNEENRARNKELGLKLSPWDISRIFGVSIGAVLTLLASPSHARTELKLAFGPAIARRLRAHRPIPHRRWHLDEMFVRIGTMASSRSRSAAVTSTMIPGRIAQTRTPSSRRESHAGLFRPLQTTSLIRLR